AGHRLGAWSGTSPSPGHSVTASRRADELAHRRRFEAAASSPTDQPLEGGDRSGVAEMKAHDRPGAEAGGGAGDDGVSARVLVVAWVDVEFHHGAITGTARFGQDHG